MWPSNMAICEGANGCFEMVPIEEVLMPVERVKVSTSQLAEMLEVDPLRLVGVEKSSTGFVIVLEPKEKA